VKSFLYFFYCHKLPQFLHKVSRIFKFFVIKHSTTANCLNSPSQLLGKWQLVVKMGGILPNILLFLDEKSTGGTEIVQGITSSWMSRGIHKRNGYSAVNYQLMDKKSTVGITFRSELLAHRRGIYRRNEIPLGNYPAQGGSFRLV
jgi:hypothetical protein